MKYKIITDSSSNLTHLEGIDFSVVPLSINENNSTNKTFNTTVTDWLKAFEDADVIFGITFTSHLSNSFEAAREAKRIYETKYPNKKVLIIDSLSVGPQIQLMVSKLKELIESNKSYQDIRNQIMDYKQNTRLIFLTKNLTHFSNNGRINPAIAKHATHLGYNIFGKANYEGSLVSTHMYLGQTHTFKKIIQEIQATGYKAGRLIISHTHSQKEVEKLCDFLKETFKNIQIEVVNNKDLCSYYIKNNGIFIGYEI